MDPYTQEYNLKIAKASEKQNINSLFRHTLEENSSTLSLFLLGRDLDRDPSGLFDWSDKVIWGQQVDWDWIIVSRQESRRVGGIKCIPGNESKFLRFEYLPGIDQEIEPLIEQIKNEMDKLGYIVGDQNKQIPDKPSIGTYEVGAGSKSSDAKKQPTKLAQKLPRTKGQRDKWKKIWNRIQEMYDGHETRLENRYYDDDDDYDGDNSDDDDEETGGYKLEIADLQDDPEIKRIFGRKPSDRTIEKIIAEGEAGHLN